MLHRSHGARHANWRTGLVLSFYPKKAKLFITHLRHSLQHFTSGFNFRVSSTAAPAAYNNCVEPRTSRAWSPIRNEKRYWTFWEPWSTLCTSLWFRWYRIAYRKIIVHAVIDRVWGRETGTHKYQSLSNSLDLRWRCLIRRSSEGFVKRRHWLVALSHFGRLLNAGKRFYETVIGKF